MTVGLNYKDKTPIIPLDFINSIIINKVTRAIHDQLMLIDLNTPNNMPRMSKDYISTCINQGMRKRNVFLRGTVSPVWAPMSRYDQQINRFFGPSYYF